MRRPPPFLSGARPPGGRVEPDGGHEPDGREDLRPLAAAQGAGGLTEDFGDHVLPRLR